MKTIAVPFRFASDTKGVAEVFTLSQIIEQQIIDILTTSSGERVMNPRYGAGLRNLLFEMMDPLVFAEYRMDAVAELNEYLTLGRVVDINISVPEEVFYGENTDSTINIAVKYIVPPNDAAVVTFNLTNYETAPLGGAF